MVRVLVVDDQILIRAGLVALLNAAPGMEVVGDAADGKQAIAMAAEHSPDVVVMDVRMPGLDGISATRQIVSQGDPPPRVLILTTFDLDEYVYQALREGASGFLLKDTPPERLLAAVTTVAAGDMLFAPTVTRRLIEAYAPSGVPGAGEYADQLATLTARELEVVRWVARGLSNQDIADQLVVSEATVKTHLNRAMVKLRLTNRAQAVVYAYEAGLVTPRRMQAP
ncbi:DNA-binding NarL/FixJ family response regulator [Hamadaea flava]|uniref:Response regulator n=1 Tax=Hamadaea flava TaxID=1742688 RepID=A0ABV8LPB3_9ACTN|nr:response regulator transcription factor [Hamadaea flava]MCP2322807.1 DNA-binding NarL/FixJ family response regulator [Hamadaea flava]